MQVLHFPPLHHSCSCLHSCIMEATYLITRRSLRAAFPLGAIFSGAAGSLLGRAGSNSGWSKGFDNRLHSSHGKHTHLPFHPSKEVALLQSKDTFHLGKKCARTAWSTGTKYYDMRSEGEISRARWISPRQVNRLLEEKQNILPLTAFCISGLHIEWGGLHHFPPCGIVSKLEIGTPPNSLSRGHTPPLCLC